MFRRRHGSWIAAGLVAVAVMTARIEAAPRQSTLATAIDSLGAFEFPTRMAASRTVRRAPAAQAVPALTAAVRSHKDSYVRYRALVLLVGFDDPATPALIRSVMADPNDRLRALAYEWFERHPDGAPVAALVEALPKETSEFVRPALTRALAAMSADPRARQAIAPLVMSGEDFFRGEVIQALGDYNATWASASIVSVAKLDGPLQDDAVLAVGKIGDATVVPVLAALQKQASRERQPAIAAAICMSGTNSDGMRKYLDDTLRFAAADNRFQSLLRTSSHAIGALAARGDQDALASLLTVGSSAREQARAPIALAFGAAAVQNPEAIMTALAARKTDQAAAIELLRDAFDMLEEDFAEEMFYITVRRGLWAAPEGSPARRLAEAVLQKLEF
jgi:HEAT repeat protein